MIEEIAKHIEAYAKSIAYKRLESEKLFRSELGSLISALEWHITEAKELHQQMKEQGLSINTIEAEGALRLALVIEMELQEYKDLLNEEEEKILNKEEEK